MSLPQQPRIGSLRATRVMYAAALQILLCVVANVTLTGVHSYAQRTPRHHANAVGSQMMRLMHDDELYSAESKWGRAVMQKWRDAAFPNYFAMEVQRVSSFDFWKSHFKHFLPLQPERHRLRVERSERRRRERGGRDRRHHVPLRPGPNFDVYEEWRTAFMEDPFKGFRILPLQTYRDPKREMDPLLFQLEKEQEWGSMRKRYEHVKRLNSMTGKKVFSGDPPTHPAADVTRFNMTNVRMPWMEVAQKLYVPIVMSGPNGKELARSLLSEVRLSLEHLDREALFRTGSDTNPPVSVPQVMPSGVQHAQP